MKKITATIFLLHSLLTASAQYKLSGSSYVQHFNDLAAGMPEGWDVTDNATDTTLGTSVVAGFIATPGTSTRWINSSGAFKNVASANGFANFAAGTPALQLSATDRALGVKQTGSFGDPGAAFTFCIDNTFGLSNFEMDIKIQSLDSSGGGRTTPWQVQYGFGDNPKAFSTVSTFLTGGNTFKNIPLAISFGMSLDDVREKVWIRVFAVMPSSGSSSRTTTAIDDVELRWTGTAVPSYRPLVQKLFPANGATNVPLGTVLAIDFSKNITLGTGGSITVKNETDNTIQIVNAGSAFLAASGKRLLISGVKMDLAKTYHVTFDSSVVDTASATTFALTDTTGWRFTTVSVLPHFMAEYFDTACSTSGILPVGWSKYSKNGMEMWNCFEHIPGNSAIRMYGNDGTANNDNEDWLISPKIDMSSPDAMAVAFRLYKSFSGNELKVMISHDYAGSGSPDSASWTAISLPMSAGDKDKWMTYSFPVTAFKSQPFYVGFKYNSSVSAAYDIRVDSFMTMIKTGINEDRVVKGGFIIQGYPSTNNIALQISNTPEGYYQLELFNAVGQRVYQKEILLTSGNQNFNIADVDLSSGMYIVKLANTNMQFLQKCIVR